MLHLHIHRTGAVIENHDKLFISNILGVPCNDVKPPNASKQRWIDNYSHRIDGGTVHVKNFRFGGESSGLPALVNFAPYACREVIQKPDLETEMCGRLNRSGPQVQGGVRGSGGSSIVIEGSVFSSHASHEIVLEEVPSMLVLRDNWDNNAAADGLHQRCRQPGQGPCYKLIGVPHELDLDGPYLDWAYKRGIRARPVFKIETMWNPPSVKLATEPMDTEPASVFDLPQQLQPFQEGRIEGVEPPSAGVWRAGSVVYNRRAWDANVSSSSQPLGWVCVAPGRPGVWENLSVAKASHYLVD